MNEVTWHTYHKVHNRKCHQHDFEILIAQKGDEEFKQTFSFVEYALGVRFDTALDGDMDLVDR